ncbi:MAG: hypothetical protein AB7G35_18185 [Hyphomicrobiaceae bacterium]
MDGCAGRNSDEPDLRDLVFSERLHLSMAEHYRARIANLCRLPLNRAPEAADVLPGLIEKIAFTPATIDGRTILLSELHGARAGIMKLRQYGAATRPVI